MPTQAEIVAALRMAQVQISSVYTKSPNQSTFRVLSKSGRIMSEPIFPNPWLAEIDRQYRIAKAAAIEYLDMPYEIVLQAHIATQQKIVPVPNYASDWLELFLDDERRSYISRKLAQVSKHNLALAQVIIVLRAVILHDCRDVYFDTPMGDSGRNMRQVLTDLEDWQLPAPLVDPIGSGEAT